MADRLSDQVCEAERFDRFFLSRTHSAAATGLFTKPAGNGIVTVNHPVIGSNVYVHKLFPWHCSISEMMFS
jgi:hypothetical protein